MDSCLTLASDTATGCEWETSACLHCGGMRWTTLLEAPDPFGSPQLHFRIVRCVACGLCFTNPRPTASAMGRFYASTYRPHRIPTELQRRRWLGDSRARQRWPRKEGQPLPWHGQGRLLDFGCGGGRFLERMRRLGWSVTGLDVSADVVARIRRALRLPAYTGTLPHAELVPGSFDVITMWHALEHVHHPLAVSRAAHQLLAPGGRLIVAVPNIESLPFRWFGSSWFGLELPRHLTHFSPPTLEALLCRAGFTIQSIQQVRHSDWLQASAQRAELTRSGPKWCGLLSKKIPAKLATWWCSLRGASDALLAIAVRKELPHDDVIN